MSTSDNSTYVGDDTPDWQKGDITAELLAKLHAMLPDEPEYDCIVTTKDIMAEIMAECPPPGNQAATLTFTGIPVFVEPDDNAVIARAKLLADIGKKPLSLTEKEPYDAR